MTTIKIQDPLLLAQSLITLGPSQDKSVERDLLNAIRQQAQYIEDLSKALHELKKTYIKGRE